MVRVLLYFWYADFFFFFSFASYVLQRIRETRERFVRTCFSVWDTVVDTVSLICLAVTCPTHVPPSVTTPLNCDCANSLCPSTAMWQQMAHRYAMLITECPDPRPRSSLRLCREERWCTVMCTSLPWSVHGPAPEGCCASQCKGGGSKHHTYAAVSHSFIHPPRLPLFSSRLPTPHLSVLLFASLPLHPFNPSTPPPICSPLMLRV